MDLISQDLIALALREDLGPGDITSEVIPPNQIGDASLLAKSDLVWCGEDAVREVFRQLGGEVAVHFEVEEGAEVTAGTSIGRLTGPARLMLSGERIALNLCQRMSGIATFARKCAQAVAGTECTVVDTRKTTPGLRAYEKHAVYMGGCSNHRFGLYDGVLIKDNHIAAVGGVARAIKAARRRAHHILRIECEVTTLDELDQALEAGADVVLLDNMDTDTLRAAVERTAGRAALEASGNMTLERLAEVAATGVDFISMGALTHTVIAADISLEWKT